MSRQLVLWRHGRTRWNAAGQAQEQTDIGLDELGRAQAAAAAPILASVGPTAIVSSDLSRAADTADVLAKLTGLAVTRDPDFREIDFGEREGLTWAESYERFPAEMRRWWSGADVRIPGRKTRSETAERYAGALTRYLEPLGDNDTLVVVSHGGAMRVGACRFLGLPREAWPVLGGFDNCHWAWLSDSRRGWTIEAWNVGGLPPELEAGDRAPG